MAKRRFFILTNPSKWAQGQVQMKWPYKKLIFRSNFDKIYYLGRCGANDCMVLELLGPNLEDLFELCGQRFTLKTTLMIGFQGPMLQKLFALNKCSVNYWNRFWLILSCSKWVCTIKFTLLRWISTGANLANCKERDRSAFHFETREHWIKGKQCHHISFENKIMFLHSYLAYFPFMQCPLVANI